MKLFGYEIKKAEKDRSGNSLQQMSNVMLLPWEYGREVYTPQNYAQLVAAYTGWVYVCASKNSNAVAAANLKLYVGKGSKNTKIIAKTIKLDRPTEDRVRSLGSVSPYCRKAAELEEVIEHPFLEMIRDVNPLINRFQLWDLSQLWLELTGNAYWFIYKDAMGVPRQLWPLPPQKTQIVGSREKLVSGYVYSNGTLKIPFEFDEIIHFQFSNPSGSLYGLGPLAPIMQTYIDDINIRSYESTLAKNMGRPEAVLQTDQPLSDKDFDRIKTRYNQQYGRSTAKNKVLILEQNLKYTPITMSPREMNYIVGRKMNREEIAAAFGVPMSKLTTEDVNRSNAQSGNWQYQNDTVEPRLRRIEEEINAKLMPMYASNLVVAYDSTLPEDKAFELTRRTAYLGSYVTTVNEEREKLGMDKVPWGDAPLAPAGIGPLGEQKPSAPGIEGQTSGKPNEEKPNEATPLEQMSDEQIQAEINVLENSKGLLHSIFKEVLPEKGKARLAALRAELERRKKKKMPPKAEGDEKDVNDFLVKVFRRIKEKLDE